MSFKISIIPLDSFDLIELIDISSETHIQICTRGALLNSWTIRNNGEIHECIQGNDLDNGWHEFESNGFRSGKMSPFSCRIKNGQFEHLQQKYTLEKFYLGAHAMHGLIYDAPFILKTSTTNDESASVVLQYDYKGTDRGFPFPYHVQVKWTLQKQNQIIVETTLLNQYQQTIPIMDGWHPYFTLGGIVNDYTIQFYNQGKIEYDMDLIPTGKWLADNNFNEGKYIGEMHFDDCFKLNPIQPSCTISNTSYSLRVTALQNYPYLQLYTPNDRKSIAIENLSGVPDCFNNKMGIHYVKSQEQISFKTSYQIFIKQSPL
jgi:aldose 1-epimerase